jgi:mRNA interferase MazF
VVARRFEVHLIRLVPTRGSEIRRTCLVISPDELNQHIRTVIVAPMTTKGHPYPSRVQCTFRGKRGHVVLDQMRTVDQSRLVRKLGVLDDETGFKVLEGLREMFAD